MTDHDEVHKYRPNRKSAVALGAVFGVTAIALAILGSLLTEADVSSMDGPERLLFTVVSVRWFSWVMAAAFAALAARVTARGYRTAPALTIDTFGFTLGGEHRTPWEEVDEIRTFPKPEVLQLRLGERVVSLTSFDLGDDPEVVAERMAHLRAQRLPPE